MKVIKELTVIIVDTHNHFAAITALQRTLEEIKPKKAIFFTDLKFESSSFEVIKIKKIKNKYEYSDFIVKQLNGYLETENVLVCQHDGYVIDGKQWDKRFLECDYAGALWQYPQGEYNCGNGGLSIRSKKLMNILAADPKIEITHPEDEITGRLYRRYLEEKYKIKFASDAVANKFSFELNEPTASTLGFHGHFHHPFRKAIVIKRSGAMGDLILCEPVFDYYSNLGYRVYVDTPQDLFQVFAHYRHIIKHISELKPGTKVEKTIDLDMSYERKPKQLVLKSYYEECGIEDGEIRNSKLYLHYLDGEPLFNNYIVIHADDTGIPHRNINGLKWFKIVEFLKEQGFLIIQTGKRTTTKIPGTIHFNASTKHFLMFLLRDAKMFIGLDSGLAQIAVAFNIPSVIFFGSVNPEYRYPNLEKIKIVHTDCPLNKDYYCYHEVVDWTVGKDCEVKKELPPCSVFSADQVIEKIKELL